ncbi:spore protease YyaC [Paenibacillus sp.]|jgi:putative sporulation protein YyaC|uniref:spore protease YyaC n=1 Tax=Paenibacillus sp. TaxID=58172 RepID=UPI002827D8FD|nr:spore protease YyaC [Paenibacillus sp.]MDR0270938.1 spore protease YyaC [Paenibacillus sp.]
MSFQDPHSIRGKGGNRKKIVADGLSDFFVDIHSRHRLDQITFLCIGTDRSTGDALGPLTGSELVTYGFPNVIGTLSSPCDASCLIESIAKIPGDQIVVAIDACLGQPLSVGSFLVSDEPLFPAQSVGHALPAVGHYSIAAVVNAAGPRPYSTLQMTSLYHVMTMARHIASAAADVFGLAEKTKI